MPLAIEKIFPIEANTVLCYYMNDSLLGVGGDSGSYGIDLDYDHAGSDENPTKVDGFGKDVFSTDDDGWTFGRGGGTTHLIGCWQQTRGTNIGFAWWECICKPPTATSGINYFMLFDDDTAGRGILNQVRFRMSGHDVSWRYRGGTYQDSLISLSADDFTGQPWMYLCGRLGLNSTAHQFNLGMGRLESDTDLTFGATRTLGFNYPVYVVDSLGIGGIYSNSEIGLDDGVVSVVRLQLEDPPDDTAIEARYDEVRTMWTDGEEEATTTKTSRSNMNSIGGNALHKDVSCGLVRPTDCEVIEINSGRY